MPRTKSVSFLPLYVHFSVLFRGERVDPPPCIFKKYGAHFIWGQLVMWYKQTVNDPTASLSAERRGTLSLPDIESCYHRQHGSYTSKDRKALLEQLHHRPDAMWKVGTIFTFKNEAKIYGSPMFDAVLSSHSGMTEILHHLSMATATT